MRLKIDENIGLSVKDFLNDLGHDCHSVFDEGIEGGPDKTLAEICRTEHRHLLTLDLDFADIIEYPPNLYHGFIVLRLGSQFPNRIISRLEEVLSELNSLQLKGHLIIVDKDKIRMR